jgi:hypothetical protein
MDEIGTTLKGMKETVFPRLEQEAQQSMSNAEMDFQDFKMDMDSQFQKAEQDNNDKLSRLKTSVTNQMDDVNSEIKDEADKIYQALDANHNDVTRMAEGAARKSMTDIQGVKAALGKVNDGISGIEDYAKQAQGKLTAENAKTTQEIAKQTKAVENAIAGNQDAITNFKAEANANKREVLGNIREELQKALNAAQDRLSSAEATASEKVSAAKTDMRSKTSDVISTIDTKLAPITSLASSLDQMLTLLKQRQREIDSDGAEKERNLRDLVADSGKLAGSEDNKVQDLIKGKSAAAKSEISTAFDKSLARAQTATADFTAESLAEAKKAEGSILENGKKVEQSIKNVEADVAGKASAVKETLKMVMEKDPRVEQTYNFGQLESLMAKV